MDTVTEMPVPLVFTDNAASKVKQLIDEEGNADLLALYNGVSLSGDAQRLYVYDNVDIAETINFLVVRALTGDVDCCHKNYYIYRDTEGTGEW